MPIDRKRYPDNWRILSLKIKEKANWTCQNCGKHCRKSQEPLSAFLRRAFSPDSEAWVEALSHPQRYCLTVAHLDQDPGNNLDDNLKALCAPCHLKHDKPYQVSNSYSKRERNGQLKIF